VGGAGALSLLSIHRERLLMPASGCGLVPPQQKRYSLGREGREILTGPVLRIGVVEIGKAVAS